MVGCQLKKKFGCIIVFWASDYNNPASISVILPGRGIKLGSHFLMTKNLLVLLLSFWNWIFSGMGSFCVRTWAVEVRITSFSIFGNGILG